MCFRRDTNKGHKAMFILGLVFMILANAWPRLLHTTFGLGPDWVDGVRGLLFGISFGLLLWGIRLNCRRGGLR
jgi:hypothetical protein